MDVTYVSPFVESVDSVFATMLGVRPTHRRVKASHGGSRESGAALTSMVGLTGQVNGVVALRFPPKTALELAARMLGCAQELVNDEVIDAISELVNMVAGSAKAKIHQDPPLELGLPTVVEGASYRVKYPTSSIWLEVPFSSDAGDFCMEVTYTRR